ncbi:ROK family transcriptional regulator [Devosia rhodophyticola]|uniref:ROK family transcriptional regulator n=1 Tax=Devosia rhodophyticola TaxID=3026423 RepID=A0ABY7Z0H8_9HYPH|nr:ROK family transcriptional regulator [Devosia rhodophyticola]WDR06964.1 ROK family transcriptional regulator [Devosia rhodophyticola]
MTFRQHSLSLDRHAIRRFHANTIFHRIRIEPNTSQAEIIARTGIDKSSVSSIVNNFVDLGLVERSAKKASNGRGRPSEGLVIAPTAGILVGAQVEANKIEFVACLLNGTLLSSVEQGFDGTLAGLDSSIRDGFNAVIKATQSSAKVLGMGVCLPGLVDNAGLLVHVPVLGWHDVEVTARLSTITGVPVFVGNDGNAAAMAEHTFGSCIDLNDFLFLFSGSGVGGGLFLDGAIYRGAGGLAGELGHVKVVPQGRFCTCGSSGCLAAYLVESAIIEEIYKLSGQQLSHFKDILDIAERGDPMVLNVLDHAGVVLGSAVSSLINIFNPPLVVLSGNLSSGRKFIENGLDRAVQRLAHPAMLSRTTIRFAENPNDMLKMGGVALALDGVTSLDGMRVAV